MCVSFAGGMEKAGQRDDSLRRRVQVIPSTFTHTNKNYRMISPLFTQFLSKEISRMQLTTFTCCSMHINMGSSIMTGNMQTQYLTTPVLIHTPLRHMQQHTEFTKTLYKPDYTSHSRAQCTIQTKAATNDYSYCRLMPTIVSFNRLVYKT